MSAENAWKVAAAYCREAVIKEMMENIQDFSPAHVSERLNSLPMPPAFRAEVEAEAEELRGMLAEAEPALKGALGVLEITRDEGFDEHGDHAWQSKELADLCDQLRALLSRLEAKGEEKP